MIAEVLWLLGDGFIYKTWIPVTAQGVLRV